MEKLILILCIFQAVYHTGQSKPLHNTQPAIISRRIGRIRDLAVTGQICRGFKRHRKHLGMIGSRKDRMYRIGRMAGEDGLE